MKKSQRQPLLRIHADAMIVDGFAGGGGTSLGIEWALGRSPDIALNHDPEAIAMHARNHPNTRHLLGDIWDSRPLDVTRGRAVDLLWLSPDCTFHSKARGTAPFRDPKSAKGRRGLAWVATRWAKDVHPRIIVIENVEELQDWGPIGADGKPCQKRKGKTFRAWVARLRNLGYAVEWRELRACDYGAPTIRKRLFVVARCDGKPIVWPEKTHGKGLEPYRTAAECIQWEIPAPSIFDRKRPLADKTLARIGRGMWRFVLDAPDPFIIPVTHHGDLRSHPVTEPMRTVTAAHRGEHALIAPTLIQTGYGERKGQAPRSMDLHQPLGTIMAGGCKHALVTAFLAKHFSERKTGGYAGGQSMKKPAGSVTVRDHHALVAASMVKLYGSCADGQSLEQPAPTVTVGGNHQALVASSLIRYNGRATGQPVDQPINTITVGPRFAEIRAFLTKYNGTAVGQSMHEPVDTVTTHDRFGLVTVDGQDYAIADIGMRMLSPRELFRAQGFPDSYVIDPLVWKRQKKKMVPLDKTGQIRMCGNSVPPHLACAVVKANFPLEVKSTNQLSLVGVG